MGAGDPEYKKALILQAVHEAGRLNQSEVASAAGLKRSTTQRLLSEMTKSGKIQREEVRIAGRKGRYSWGYTYWVDGDVPPPPKEAVTTISRVLVCVTGEMDSAQIAKAAGLSVSAAQGFLAELARQGLVGRRRVPNSRKAGWKYLYYPGKGESAADIPSTVKEMDDDWWASIYRAVEEARPGWRTGELFPKEEACQTRNGLHASNGRTVGDWCVSERTSA